MAQPSRTSMQQEAQIKRAADNDTQSNIFQTNVVYLVITRPSEVKNNPCYGIFDGCFSTADEAYDHLHHQTVFDLVDPRDVDLEDDQDVKNQLASSEAKVIPWYGLDKSKPIFVKKSGNYFFVGISNDKPSEKDREEWEIDTYDFSASVPKIAQRLDENSKKRKRERQDEDEEEGAEEGHKKSRSG